MTNRRHRQMKKGYIAQFQREQLHRAAREGDLACVDELLNRKYPVNRFDYLGNTPLHYAVEGEHLEVVDRLIKGGANVDANDERIIGDTPLGWSAGKCSYEMARRLIDAGADPTIPGWMQLTAIHRAARRTDADAGKVQRLLKGAVDRR